MGESPLRISLLGRVFLPFATGYFLSNFFRSINAVIAPELVHEIGLSASELGLLTSAYFFAFACFQLPLGLFLDRYGPRRVQFFMLLIAGLGSVVFAAGEGLTGLTLGRTLIGLGLSGCLMASFKAFTIWYPQRRLPAVNGYLLAFGGLGAMTATAPVEIFLQSASWRELFLILSICCIGTGMLVWHVVPASAGSGSAGTLRTQLRSLGKILTGAPFLIVGPVAFFSHGLGLAVTTLWSGSWFRDIGGLDEESTAQALLLLMISITAGSALWGAIATHLSRHGISIATIAGFGGILFLFVNSIVSLQPSSGHVLLWMGYGFTLTSGSLLYASMTSMYDVSLAGRVNTALNLAVFIGAFTFQWGFGLIIDYWQSALGGGIDAAYRAAFGISVLFQGASISWYFYRRPYLASREGRAGN